MFSYLKIQICRLSFISITSWSALRCPRHFLNRIKKISIFLAYVTPGYSRVPSKNFSRVASYSWHIDIHYTYIQIHQWKCNNLPITFIHKHIFTWAKDLFYIYNNLGSILFQCVSGSWIRREKNGSGSRLWTFM